MEPKHSPVTIIGILTMIMLVLSSCSTIEGIFEAGMWTGVIVVVGIIALIVFIIFRFFRKR